jgi:hypothetical protein
MKDIASYRFIQLLAEMLVAAKENSRARKTEDVEFYIQGENKLAGRVLQVREGATQTTHLTDFGRKAPWWIASSIAIQMTFSLIKK